MVLHTKKHNNKCYIFYNRYPLYSFFIPNIKDIVYKKHTIKIRRYNKKSFIIESDDINNLKKLYISLLYIQFNIES